MTPTPKPMTFYIMASAGGHGTIIPQGTITAGEGTDHTFTVTPDAGYQTVDVVVDGVSQGTIKSYTFSDVSTNHTIAVTFTADTNPSPGSDSDKEKDSELPPGIATKDVPIVINDGQTGTSSIGKWSISGASDPYGSKSHYSMEVGATYSFESAITGSSEVSIWWSTYSNRCTLVPVEVYDGAHLLETVYVNQQENGGVWNFLGQYEFTRQARVVVVVADSDCSTSADAIRYSEH